MPRPTRQSVDGLPVVEPIRRPEPTRISGAAPRISPVAPQDGGAFQLAQALQAFNPGITSYLLAQQKDINEDEFVAGQKARTTQSSDAVSLAPEQSDWFQRGYMTAHGRLSGQNTARRMMEEYETKKLTEGFDSEQFIGEFVANESRGLTDTDALKGFLPHVAQARELIRESDAKLRIERVRAERDAKVDARARDVVEIRFTDAQLQEAPAAQLRHRLYTSFVSEAMSMGKTRTEAADKFVDALVNEAIRGKNPTVLDAASIRDKDGIALIDNAAFGAKINAARAKAETLEREAIVDSTVDERTASLHDLHSRLLKDPMDPELDWEALGKHQGQYLTFHAKDGSDRVAFWLKVWDARQKSGEAAKIAAGLQGDDSRIWAARPEAKPIIDAAYGKVWDAFQANPADADSFVRANLTLLQKWGVRDQRLHTLLSKIDTDPPKDGKPSPDFERAITVYNAIMSSPNKDMIYELVDERSRTLLGHFSDLVTVEGLPLGEAFAKAKELNSPEGKKRIESLVTPQVRQEFRAALTSELKGGWFSRAPNSAAFISTMTDVFERKVGTLGDPKAAMKQTVAEVGAYLTQDAHDNWTLFPSNGALQARNADRTAFSEGLKAYTQDMGVRLKEEGVDDVSQFNLWRIGDGSAYAVYVNGAPRGRVELDQLIERGRAQHVSGESAVRISEIGAKARAGTLTGAEADASWWLIEQARATGAMNAIHYGDLQVKRHQFLRERRDAEAARARDAVKDVLGGLDPKDILAEPGALPEEAPQDPGGKNLKTADYAARALREGNLQFALTAQAEGFMTKVHDDPARGRNLGLGFSVTSRTDAEVRSMLRQAGVAPSDLDEVLAGKREVTPEVVMRLHKLAVPEYERRAQKAIGSDAWVRLKPEARAVLTDMAWVAGNPKKFTEVLDAMRKGDWDAASAALSLKYRSRRSGQLVDDHRRVNLWRLMLSGPRAFEKYLSKFTTK